MKIKTNISEKYELIKEFIQTKTIIFKKTRIYYQLFKNKFQINEEKHKSQIKKYNNNPKSKFKSNSTYKTLVFHKSIILE